MDFIDYCDRDRTLLAIHPPHSTHTLQGLDVVMFKPLSPGHSQEVSRFMERCQGLIPMSKRDFYPLFVAAWKASFKETTIFKAFEAKGPLPFNPEVILKRLNIQDDIEASGDSESSALSSYNWRETESLLQQVVKNRGNSQAQKLSQVFHSMSVQKTLPAQETQGFKEALINERLRRKQGKALPLEASEECHGGAVFCSPRKVKEARDQLQYQKAEEEQQRLQKAEAARLYEELRRSN
jgi:hypothetical protein